MALAPFIHLPMAVAAMGFAFWCGLITAGMGLTMTIAEGLHKVLPLILLGAVIGALSGALAHLAGSMFYTSDASPAGSCRLRRTSGGGSAASCTTSSPRC